MFDDMAKPCSRLQAADKAARLLVAASMRGKARKQSHQMVREQGQPIGGPFFERAEIDMDPDHRPIAEEMRAAIDAALHYGDRKSVGKGTSVSVRLDLG